MQARKGVPYGGIGTSLLSAPCLWCGPSPSPSRPPSGTTTGRDLLSDPWRRENGEGAVANEEKEGRSSLGWGVGCGESEVGRARGTKRWWQSRTHFANSLARCFSGLHFATSRVRRPLKPRSTNWKTRFSMLRAVNGNSPKSKTRIFRPSSQNGENIGQFVKTRPPAKTFNTILSVRKIFEI